jgi:hypothetical protein
VHPDAPLLLYQSVHRDAPYNWISGVGSLHITYTEAPFAVKRHTPVEIVVFVALIALGVAGRWLQPDWHFTPTAAVAVFAGYYFTSALAAALAPVTVLAISNLLLRPYTGVAETTVVYVAFLLPVLLGRGLRSQPTAARFALGALVPAITFYLSTNFAVWAFNRWYPTTWQGLVECYVQAIPFFRTMLAGDVCYVCVVFGAYALATMRVGHDAPAPRNRLAGGDRFGAVVPAHPTSVEGCGSRLTSGSTCGW